MIFPECSKCGTLMQPGFPVEVGANAGLFVTGWSDELPRDVAGLFGGRAFLAARPVESRLMGFACPQCGFVELYKVSEEQLRQFLDARNAEQVPVIQPAIGKTSD